MKTSLTRLQPQDEIEKARIDVKHNDGLDDAGIAETKRCG